MLAKFPRPINVFFQYCQLFGIVSLLIIFCCQCFIHFFIIGTFTKGNGLIGNFEFMVFAVATLLITAAGFLFSGYYDFKVNPAIQLKRGQVGKTLSPSKAYNIGFVLNIIGCLLGIWAAWKIGFFNLGLLFIVFATVLYFYSLRYKRLFFWGTFSISLIFSFFPIAYVWLFDFFALRKDPIAFGNMYTSSILKQINYFIVGYAVFAFLLIFLKETLRDILIEKRNENNNGNSFLSVCGSKKTKLIIAIMTLIFIGLLVVVEVLFYNTRIIKGFYVIWGIIILFQIPLLIFLYLLIKARSKEDYFMLLNVLNFLILMGLASMLMIPYIIL